MDAPPTAPTMAGGWDINSSSPPSAPQFTSTFDMKPSIMDASRSHLNVGLTSSPALTPSLGDYLANHSHRLIVGSNFVQPPMIGLRTTVPTYYMKDFAPRSEEFVSVFDQSRPTRRGDVDLAGAESPPDMSLSTPGVPENRLHDDTDASIACLPQFASRLLPMLSAQKNVMTASNMDVKVEDEKGNGDDDDGDEDEDDDEDGGDDDDNDGTAWPSQMLTSGSVSAAMTKAIVVLRQGVSTGGSSPIACQDCGNQAKKDCEHMRCRTCCKSRGLDCATHVKSTWVPAYKRRQRQHLLSNDNEQPIKLLRSRTARVARPSLEQGAASDVVHAANSHTSTSTDTPPTSDLNWLQQEGRLKKMPPAEARENAVFKCVKVTGIDDGHEEFAYQTVVRIGGHIYKGLLYDQGVDKGQVSSSSIAELRLGGRSAAPSSSATIDLAGNLYGTSESVFLGGNNATATH